MRDQYPLINELCDMHVDEDKEAAEMKGWETLVLRLNGARFPLSSNCRMEFEFAVDP